MANRVSFTSGLSLTVAQSRRASTRWRHTPTRWRHASRARVIEKGEERHQERGRDLVESTTGDAVRPVSCCAWEPLLGCRRDAALRLTYVTRALPPPFAGERVRIPPNRVLGAADESRRLGAMVAI